MKFAYRAKLFAFASLLLVAFLFPPSTQPVISASNISVSSTHQVASAKLLHSYIYRQTAFLTDTNLSIPGSRTTEQFSRSLPVRSRIYIDPVLDQFRREVINGDAHMIRGIYAPGKFALQVVQQPKDDWSYVSGALGEVTQFQSAQSPVTGLLAHNYLEGQRFYGLSIGEELELLYGNGSARRYRISDIFRYQKLDVNSMSGDMIDLSDGKRVTTGDVFRKVYMGADRLTLQTCLEGEGLSNWGLYFVLAQPVTNNQLDY